MEFKKYVLFWLRVLRRFVSEIRLKEQTASALIAVVVVIIASYYSAKSIAGIDLVQTFWTSFTRSSPGETLNWTITLIILLFLNGLIQPAKMYDELGGFIDEPFQLSARDPVPDNRPESEARSGSITVKNVAPKTRIENCFLTIDSIIDEHGTQRLFSQARKVSWSSGLRENSSDNRRINREIDIRPRVPVVADLVETQNNVIIPTTWSPHPSLEVGKYEFLVTPHGIFKSNEVGQSKIFIVEYTGKNNVTVSEKGNK